MPPGLLTQETLAQKLVLSLRLPRLIMALLLGMSLAGCGEVLQMLFRNPIVEPGFLGVSQGAAFGAALAILYFGGSQFNVEISAAFFALLGLASSFFKAFAKSRENGAGRIPCPGACPRAAFVKARIGAMILTHWLHHRVHRGHREKQQGDLCGLCDLCGADRTDRHAVSLTFGFHGFKDRRPCG